MSQQKMLGVLLAATIAAAGWVELPQMPEGNGRRCVKDGGWLAYDSATARIYAAKGNKCYEFFAYDPAVRTWIARTDCPTGDENRPVGRGAAGASNRRGEVFATKGHNTNGFHSFSASGNAWTQLPDVPLGSQGKRCNGGTDVVFVPNGGAGSVYLLKGRVRDFFRYDIATRTWEAMPDAPAGNMFNWDKGSWLAYDGNGIIYAHKAKSHELHRYDIAARRWLEPPLSGMPVFSALTGKSKKSKDGAAGVFLDGKLYALKGGNTQELWCFDPAGNWTELDTIPQTGACGGKRKVKAGGDLCTDGRVLYALKGARTNQFWRYTPVAAGSQPEPAPGGAQYGTAPARAILDRTEPTGRARFAVYNASGRLVKTGVFCPGSGSVLDAPGLPAGVYLVKFDAVAQTAPRRAIVR